MSSRGNSMTRAESLLKQFEETESRISRLKQAAARKIQQTTQAAKRATANVGHKVAEVPRRVVRAATSIPREIADQEKEQFKRSLLR